MKSPKGLLYLLALSVTYTHCLPVATETLPIGSLPQHVGQQQNLHSSSDQPVYDANLEIFRRSSYRSDIKSLEPNGPPLYQGNVLSDLKAFFSSSSSEVKQVPKVEKKGKAPKVIPTKATKKWFWKQSGQAQNSKKPVEGVELQDMNNFLHEK